MMVFKRTFILMHKGVDFIGTGKYMFASENVNLPRG